MQKKSRKWFRGITIALTVLIVWQLAKLGLQLIDDGYQYHYDEEDFLYAIQDGRYSELPEKKRRNEMEQVKADAQLQECYAVADYYEAAFMYYMYLQNGDEEKEQEAESNMKTAQSGMGELEYCAAEINSYFVHYFNP